MKIPNFLDFNFLNVADQFSEVIGLFDLSNANREQRIEILHDLFE